MTPMTEKEKAEVLRERAVVSVIISCILPGLGHIYKGHYSKGFLLMFLGIPMAVWAGILLSLATAGIGLILPIGFWAAVALNAYYAEDLRKHHVMDVL